MDITIGIAGGGREVLVKSDLGTDEVETRFAAALAEGPGGTVAFDDQRGKRIVVVAAHVAYIDFGDVTGKRPVGFLSN